MEKIILEGKSDLSKRIDFLTKLFDNAESRVLHSDSYRQKNINYALIVFAALFVLGCKTEDYSLHILISFALLSLMIFFTIWDRRWHKIKHGWDYSKKIFREKIVSLINNPADSLELFPYYVEGEKTAEYKSLMPTLFYILIIGSVTSFFLFKFIE